MTRTWLPILAALALSCAPAPAPDAPAQGGVPLRVSGSTTLGHKLVPALISAYGHERGGINFALSQGGSAAGLRDLLDGNAQIAASSRLATPAEREQAKVNGYDLDTNDSRHIIAVDVVALSVHPSIPLESLTYDQVIGIFCTRAIDNWSFLGLDDRPIHALARDTNSGTRALFEDFFCGPRGIHPKVESTTPEAIAKALAEDPSAIAFVTRSEASGKVLGLRPDAGGKPIFPTQQNIIRGAYPLYHDLYLYTAGAPTGAAADFIEFIGQPGGQYVVDEQGFVPLFLRPQSLNEPRPLRETIHFEPGSSAPNQRSLARLQLLVSELKERAGEYRHIVLEGYTDNQEPEADALSKARAEAVKSMLEADLPGLYFEIIPRASDRPIAPNDTPYGRQRNRRVQVYLAAEETAAAPKSGDDN